MKVGDLSFYLLKKQVALEKIIFVNTNLKSTPTMYCTIISVNK